MSLLMLAFAFAQNVDAIGYARLMAMPVPVIASDITDQPYRVVAEIKAEVTKPTRFSRDPSDERLRLELWRQAQRAGAHAVVNARLGEAVPGGWFYGRRRAYGQAVVFIRR